MGRAAFLVSPTAAASLPLSLLPPPSLPLPGSSPPSLYTLPPALFLLRPPPLPARFPASLRLIRLYAARHKLIRAVRETAIVGLGLGGGLKQRDGFGLKESRTRAEQQAVRGEEKRGEGGVMEEEWVSGRAVRREGGRKGEARSRYSDGRSSPRLL